MRHVRALGFAKILIAAVAAVALGGCFHVPMRAIQNGRELGYQTESQVIYGEHNAYSARQMQRMLRSSSMGWQAAKPFTPFGSWNY
jgi:hypothetical protein